MNKTSKKYKEIIKIEVSKNKRVIEIFINDDLWRKIDKKLYVKYLSKIRCCESKKELDELFSIIDPQIALGVAYKLLSLRGYLAGELAQKLIKRGFDEQAAHQVILQCQKAGYIDDQRESELVIRKEKRRKQGPKAIERRLQKASLSSEKAHLVTREQFSQKEQHALIQELLSSRFPDLTLLKTKQRAFRFLQRRGFDEELIYSHVFEENGQDYL